MKIAIFMLKVFIITQSEPFFIPKMIKKILENQNEKYRISGYTILKPSRKNKSISSWFYERFRLYNLGEIIIVGLAFIYIKFLTLTKITNRFNSDSIFKKFQVSAIQTDDINNEIYQKKLKDLNLDYIVSISCPQLFGKELLEIPNINCINAHGTLLPRHRGVFGTWWTLFCNDKITGGTIHTMELRLDAGQIIWQKEFFVSQSETQYSLAYKTKKSMSEGLIEVLNNKTQKLPLNHYESSYHRAPTKKQGIEFHRRGLKIIKLIDLKNIFTKVL